MILNILLILKILITFVNVPISRPSIWDEINPNHAAVTIMKSNVFQPSLK